MCAANKYVPEEKSNGPGYYQCHGDFGNDIEDRILFTKENTTVEEDYAKFDKTISRNH